MPQFTTYGKLVDVLNQRIFPAAITVEAGKIKSIEALAEADETMPFIAPGFVDAHVHIESSMLVPSQFARMAVVHGTVATVSDPHEIANVCGMEGIYYMIEDGKKVNFKFNFGAPSCVPATQFETAGATISVEDVDALLAMPDIKYLSEMMNFPGVLHGDAEVMAKIAHAQKHQKPVDGHAPGLRGDAARKYIAAGMSTDHECFSAEEALDKLQHGMKIIIREGSAAKNFEALAPLMHEHFENLFFCSDDKHPDSLEQGHVNELCARAVAKGVDAMKVLRMACVNPVLHYQLSVGLLQVGDPADFVLLNNLIDFRVLATYIDGQLVAAKGQSFIKAQPSAIINHFDCLPVEAHALRFPIPKTTIVPVIEALDGQLITNQLSVPVDQFLQADGCLLANSKVDLLKMVVVNRYRQSKPAVCFIRNFGFGHGAIASSVAHDSHNIIAVGCDDASLAEAINAIVAAKGGVSCVDENGIACLALPVAGLMSNEDGYSVAKQYTAIDQRAKALGSSLAAPYMTLSFMALLVIPHLKLSDLGLFDGDHFRFVD
jgi:adenine deaminase